MLETTTASENDEYTFFSVNAGGGLYFLPSWRGEFGGEMGVDLIFECDEYLPEPESVLLGLIPPLLLGGGTFAALFFTGNEEMAAPPALLVSAFTFTGILNADALDVGYFGGLLLSGGFAAGFSVLGGYLMGDPIPLLTGSILGMVGGTLLGSLGAAVLEADEEALPLSSAGWPAASWEGAVRCICPMPIAASRLIGISLYIRLTR